MHVLGAGLVAQLEKDLLAMRATRVRLLGWEDHPGEVNDTPLQYSCLENLMDRGAWQDTVHKVTESDTTEATWRAHMHRAASYMEV